MSFTVSLCNNKSDKRVLSKSITILRDVTGNLRDSTSIIDPVIIVECDHEIIKSLNYLKIDDFKRSYYVKNIKSVRNNLWEISCHVDVLSSFAEDIKSNEAIIKRQEGKWNLFLNDNSIKCYQNPHVITREFPNGFSTTNMSYILLVAGRPVDGWFDDSNTEVEG